MPPPPPRSPRSLTGAHRQFAGLRRGEPRLGDRGGVRRRCGRARGLLRNHRRGSRLLGDLSRGRLLGRALLGRALGGVLFVVPPLPAALFEAVALAVFPATAFLATAFLAGAFLPVPSWRRASSTKPLRRRRSPPPSRRRASSPLSPSSPRCWSPLPPWRRTSSLPTSSRWWRSPLSSRRPPILPLRSLGTAFLLSSALPHGPSSVPPASRRPAPCPRASSRRPVSCLPFRKQTSHRPSPQSTASRSPSSRPPSSRPPRGGRPRRRRPFPKPSSGRPACRRPSGFLRCQRSQHSGHSRHSDR